MGALLKFPVHRARRPRRGGDQVFAALADASRLEETERRFVWACALASAMLNVALLLSVG